MKRYILPTTDWSSLVPIIIRDAQAGAVMEVHTEEMADLVRGALDDAGRSNCTSCSETRALRRRHRPHEGSFGGVRTR